MDQLKSIVVGIDFSDCSKAALHQAVRVTRWNNATLHALHGLEYLVISEAAEALHWSYEMLKCECVSDAHRELSAWLTRAEAPAGATAQVELGPPIDTILRKVRETAADLLVLGVHGESRFSSGAGTLATKCMRKAPTKVMLVQERASQPFRTVVACVDFSEMSREAVVQALRVGTQDQSEVHFLHVFDGPLKWLHYRAETLQAVADFQREHRLLLEQRLKAFVGDTAGVAPHFAVFDASNHRCGIAAYARQVNADLLVLGTKGRTNLKYVLLGSTVERLLRDVPCSVLTVKPRGEGVRVPLENPDQPQ